MQDSPPERARRYATVLFADVSGFTEMSHNMDPEDVHDAMNQCLAFLGSIVTRHGGYIDNYIGDCIVALFGAPRALEDAPRRAVNAAIEMRNALAPFVKDRRLPPTLDVHIGINSGLVMAGDVGGEAKRHFTVMGDPVNLASRLKDKAATREILVGQQTWSETRSDFEYREIPRLVLKGMDQPITAYAVLSERGRTHRDRPGEGARALQTGLVGRERELGELRSAFARLAEGRGGIVSVVGEAGLGKSRLVDEALALPERGEARVLEARALSMGEQLSFHPFIDLLRQWAGIAEDDGETQAREKLDRAITEVLADQAAEVIPFVTRLMGMPPTVHDQARLAGIDAEGMEKLIARSVRTLVAGGAARRPLIVFFEDVHWADLSSIQLLLTLLPLAREHAIVLLLAYRPDYEQTSRRLLAALQERFADVHVPITLERLDNRQCAELLRQLIRHDDRPHTTRSVILPRADGNPFFIEEVVRSLIDVGAIERVDDGLRVTAHIEQVEVPATIQEVVMARVDRLAEQPRHVLQLAAVIGRTFPARLLEAVADPADGVAFAIERLKRRELLEDARMGGEAGYAFKHALAHETVYESIPKRRRRSLHAGVASSIEQLFAERLSDYYGMLAYHFGRAEELDKASEYLLKAGDEAERSAASSEALLYFSEAARLYDVLHGAEGDPQTKAQLQKKIGLAYLNKGDLQTALDRFDAALAILGEKDPSTTAQVARRLAVDLGGVLAQVYLRRGRPGRRTPDERTRSAIEIRFHKGKAQSTSAPQGYFLSMLRGIRQIGRIDPTTVEQSCGIYAASAALFAFSGISFDVSARLLPLSERLVRTVRDQLGYRTMAFLHHYLAGDWSDDHVIDDALIEEGLRHGVFWEVNTYLGLDCERRICQGRLAEARDLIARIAAIGDEYGYDFVRGNEYFMTAYLHLQERDLDAAAEALARYYADRTEEALNLLALGTRTTIETLRGDLAAARAASTEADDIAARLGTQVAPYHLAPHLIGRWRLALTEIEQAAAAGDGGAVHANRRRLKDMARRALAVARRIARERPEAHRLMARQAWLLGRRGAAMKWLQRGIEEAERLGARPDLARLYRDAASHLDDAGVGHVAGLDGPALLERAGAIEAALRAPRRAA